MHRSARTRALAGWGARRALVVAVVVAGCDGDPPRPPPPPPAPAPPSPPAPSPPSRAATLGVAWCAAVYQPFQQQVADRYPFTATGPDLPLDELARWFAPDQGPLWAFHAAELAPLVQERDHSFRIADLAAAAAVSLAPELPAFLDRVRDVGIVMFPPGSSTPRFEFEVEIDGTPGLSEITLTVDGQVATHRNGPTRWHSMTWPGSAGAPGARLAVRGPGKRGDLAHPGAWGLWRLLAAATLSGAAGQSVYTVRWQVPGDQLGVVTVRVRPRRAETPLFGRPSRGTATYLGLFSSFRVPPSIAGGPPCSAAGASAAASGSAGG